MRGMTEGPKINIVKYEYDERWVGLGDSHVISYHVVIGFGKDCGLCVGEVRARLLNGRYLLEMTSDNKNTSEADRDVDRRFSLIGLGIVDNRENARKILSLRARRYAEEIHNWTGLDVLDSTQETQEREGELAGKVKEG
jgi:hypothetical protein